MFNVWRLLKITMKNKHFKLLTTSLVTIFLVACANTGYSSQPTEDSLVYATLEINPGIGLMIDHNHRVVYAHALNADGEMVLLELNVAGKTIEVTVNEIAAEIVALQFVKSDTMNPITSIDIVGLATSQPTQIRSEILNRIGNAFTGHMINMQTQSRTYTLAELNEAAEKGTTPIRLQLVRQALIGHDDLFEEEALALDLTNLLEKAKHGATIMNQIGGPFAAAFVEARRAIQDNYRTEILALKDAIKDALEASEDITLLQEELSLLIDAMVTEIQGLVATFRQETMMARNQWRSEAEDRRGGFVPNTSHTGSQPNIPSSLGY
jgi:hypothetical protein